MDDDKTPAKDTRTPEQLLDDARTLLRIASELMELEPASAAALIPKAHKATLAYARARGDE